MGTVVVSAKAVSCDECSELATISRLFLDSDDIVVDPNMTTAHETAGWVRLNRIDLCPACAKKVNLLPKVGRR